MGSENVFQENQEYLIKARELVVAIDDVQDNLEQARTAQEKEETAAGTAGVTGSYRTYMKQKEQKKGGFISYVMSAAMLLVICGLGVTAYQNHTKMNAMEAAILAGDLGKVAENVCNVFDPVVTSDHLELNYIKSVCHSYGALAQQMTGSGSAIFAIMDSFEYAAVVCNMLKENYPRVFIGKPV